MYRTFPIRAYADRENTAQLPTERIRQKQRCRKRFSVACGIKSFNSLSWRSGFGGHKRRKGEICFWKIFCRNRASETVFCSFAYLYGKKRQNVTKKSFVLQKIHKTHASTGKNNGAVRNLRLLQPRNNWILFTARLFSLHSLVLFRAECTNKKAKSQNDNTRAINLLFISFFLLSRGEAETSSQQIAFNL